MMHSGTDRPDGSEEAAEPAAAGASGLARGEALFDKLDLDEDDRLPWLESADDDYDDAGVDTGRVVGFVLGALGLLAIIIGAIWWLTHRGADPALVADGSTIAAPSEPYKHAPKDPGGKTFAGTGDTSYAVSQGKEGEVRLTGGGQAPTPKPSVDTSATPAPVAGAQVAQSSGGVGVQVGAFGSREKAEAGWTSLSGRSEALKGVSHRIVEGTADIGKVFRLQAVAGDDAAANVLCGKLKTSGISCQVKH